MLVLELLGTLSLRNETRPVPVTAQQKRSLGLLAVLALAGRQGLQRERIETYLWPESSSPNAQHSLEQTVYAVRHALGSDFILSTGRELRLNPDLVQVHAPPGVELVGAVLPAQSQRPRGGRRHLGAHPPPGAAATGQRVHRTRV